MKNTYIYITRIPWNKITALRNKRISKPVPALVTGAVSALGDLGINKILGNGITIKKINWNASTFQKWVYKSSNKPNK